MFITIIGLSIAINGITKTNVQDIFTSGGNRFMVLYSKLEIWKYNIIL